MSSFSTSFWNSRWAIGLTRKALATPLNETVDNSYNLTEDREFMVYQIISLIATEEREFMAYQNHSYLLKTTKFMAYPRKLKQEIYHGSHLPSLSGMVKNLPLLRGARCSLFSEAGIAAPESRRPYCILIHTQTNSSPLLSITERRMVSEY